MSFKYLLLLFLAISYWYLYNLCLQVEYIYSYFGNPGWSSGQVLVLLLLWVWCQSLVRELRSRKPLGTVKKKNHTFIFCSSISDIISFLLECDLAIMYTGKFQVFKIKYDYNQHSVFALECLCLYLMPILAVDDYDSFTFIFNLVSALLTQFFFLYTLLTLLIPSKDLQYSFSRVSLHQVLCHFHIISWRASFSSILVTSHLLQSR